MKKKVCGIGLVLGLALGGWVQGAASSATEDWLRFRGPRGLGVSQAKGLPTRWSAQQNVLWKKELPGAGASSPIVVGGRVFVTCYSGYGVPGQPGGDLSELRRHVVCLSLADGKTVWEKQVPAALPESPRVTEHGYAASTPASDGERLYVFFGKSGVFAFDLQGQQLWRADVGNKTHEWGSGASPVLYKDLVIINASVESGSLVALNRRTGQVAWLAPGISDAWNTPALVDLPNGNRELVVGVLRQVVGFDPDTGQRLWHCEGVYTYVCPSVVAHEGVVYAVLRSHTIAVRAGGRGDVTRTHLLWKASVASNVSSPIYHEGHLYLARERDGHVYCVNARTGQLVYDGNLTPRPEKLYASPVLADGKLYYVSRQGGAFVVAARPQFQQLAHNDLGDRSIFDASPAVAGGRLLLRSNRCVYCISQAGERSVER